MEKVAEMCIGVDISKKYLDVCFHETQKMMRIENTSKDVAKFVRSLKKRTIKKIVFEASGGYENLLTSVLVKNDFVPLVMDPKRIRAFAIAKGVKAKTDSSKLLKFQIRKDRERHPSQLHRCPRGHYSHI